MKTESKFYKDIRPYLDSLPNSVWFKIQAGSLRGRSDLFGCVNGRFVALELKRDGKESQSKGRAKLQSVLLKQIETCYGFSAFVTPDNFEDVYKKLVTMANRSKYT